MEKLSFKEWYTIDDVAHRLSLLSKENIRFDDVVNFILNNKLPLYIQLFDFPACLAYPASHKFRFTDNPFVRRDDYTDEEFEDMKRYIGFITSYAKQGDRVEMLKGYFKVCHYEKSFVQSNLKFFTNKTLVTFSVEEYILVHHNNQDYQLLEIGDMNIDFSEIQLLKHYAHRSTFFERNDFYIHSEDLRKFEKPETFSMVISERKESTHLKIIGAMLETMIKRGEKKRSNAFPSEAELIRDMVEQYGNVHGISKATLEIKFKEAKEILKQQ